MLWSMGRIDPGGLFDGVNNMFSGVGEWIDALWSELSNLDPGGLFSGDVGLGGGVFIGLMVLSGYFVLRWRR